MLSTLGKNFLTLVFPVACEGCGSFQGSAGDGLCAACERAVSLIQAPFCRFCGRHAFYEDCVCGLRETDNLSTNTVRAATIYEGIIQKVLCAYKFDRRKPLLAVFQKLVSRYFNDNPPEKRWDHVVAVPMSDTQKRERTFNQSEKIAQSVSRTLHIPFLKDALSMKRPTQVQSTLDKKMRKMNIHDAFRAVKKDISGKHLLLVDDILTTGETVRECARVLKEAGALSVDVFAMARGA